MKRMALIAVALCVLMIGTIGAGLVTAKQEMPAPANKQAAVTPLKSNYQFDVRYEGKVVGKLSVNTRQLTFDVAAKKLTAGTEYFLVCKDVALNLGSVKAATDGSVLLQGAWDPSVVDVAAHPTFMLALSPPIKNTEQAPTKTTITASPTAQVPGGSVTVTAHVEKYDAATSTWSAAPDAAVRLMRSAIAETQPAVTGGWALLGDYKTDASGNVKYPAQVPSIGYYGFKAWKTSFVADDPLAASMSAAVWVETKHTTHWLQQPGMERRLVMCPVVPVPCSWAVVVGGILVDEHNKAVPNQKIEVFDWATKAPVATVTTDKYGEYKWGKNYWFTDTPPEPMGVRCLGDANYRGIADTPCQVVTIYPPPPM